MAVLVHFYFSENVKTRTRFLGLVSVIKNHRHSSMYDSQPELDTRI